MRLHQSFMNFTAPFTDTDGLQREGGQAPWALLRALRKAAQGYEGKPSS